MVATILRNLRESVGKSQKEIALELCLDYKRYNHYETGRSEPDISTLIRLADFYGVSVGYLVGHKETPIAVGDEPTPSERDLIGCYRNLNTEGQEKLLSYASDLAATGNYKKSNQLRLADKQA